MSQVVVNPGHEDHIQLFLRETGIIRRSYNSLDVGESFFQGRLAGMRHPAEVGDRGVDVPALEVGVGRAPQAEVDNRATPASAA